MPEFTRESIRTAMMEQICRGLEGHRPLDFEPYASPHAYHIMFQCSKCKLYVNVHEMELETDEEKAGKRFDFGLSGPRETPPYP